MTYGRARIGVRVRVREIHRKPELRGLLGTVKQRWGGTDHEALFVRLDDGRYELFRHHELETAGGDLPIRPWWRRWR